MFFNHRAVTLAVFGLLALSSDSTIGGNSNVLVSAASWPWGGPANIAPSRQPSKRSCFNQNGAEMCIYYYDDLTCDVKLNGRSFQTGMTAKFCASLTATKSSDPSTGSQPSESLSLRASESLSSRPSKSPSLVPTLRPTVQPSNLPSDAPSNSPSDVHSSNPSSQPSESPSSQPSLVPSMGPTVQPSDLPSYVPTNAPSGVPSSDPSVRTAEEVGAAADEAVAVAEEAVAAAKEAEKAAKEALKEAKKAQKEAEKEAKEAAKKAQKEAEKAQQEAKMAAAANEEDTDMMMEDEETIFLSLMYTGRRVATVGGTEESLLFQSLGLRQRRGRRRAHAVRRRETAIKNRRENMDK